MRSATPGRSSSGRWSPETPATTRRARTTSSRRAASRALRSAGRRDLRQVQPGPADHPRGLATLRPAIRALAEAEGLLAHRDAVEARFDGAPDPPAGGRPMSPSPFAVTSPTDPPPTAGRRPTRASPRGSASRSQVLRFDLNTSPAPPEMLAGLLAANRFETTLSEYPPGDYRRLVEAAAAATASRSTRSCRAPAPTRSSTCAPRRSCPRARRRSSRSPPTPCTGSTPSSAAPG